MTKSREQIDMATKALTRYILNDIFSKYENITPDETLIIVKSVLLALIATKDEWSELGNGVS